MKTIRNFLLFIALAVTFIFFNGCSSVEPADAKITLSFTGGTIINKIQDDTLQLDTVKILIRDIKIKNQSTNDTMKVKIGPFVVYIDLAGVTTDFAVGNIPPGNYDRIKFKVHKIEGSETPPDPEFKEGTDESLRYSVIVKGIINSIPFVYKSRKSAHQDLKLETPIIVEENGVANLTIIVDPFSWFTDGANLLDPTDPANENSIDNNIKDSFKKAFRDNNHDGIID
ncbi:MAG: hypothetical protein WBQ32_04020 [Ignavibacteriaceae bacterium]